MQYNLAVEKWRQGDIKSLLNKFFPKFIYFSNRIVGIQISFIEVEDAFKYYIINNQFPINNRLTLSIKNHIKVCKNIFEVIEENESKLSIDLIKYLHDGLIGGRFAEELSAIGEETGELTNNRTEPSLVKWEQKLLVLIKDINELELNEDNALSVVSYLCCRFQTIVPYAYDSGVIVRMLGNYLLIGNDLPPIVFWENDIEAYHEALKHFSSTKEVSKMVSFLEDESYKTWLKDYNVKIKKLKDFL